VVNEVGLQKCNNFILAIKKATEPSEWADNLTKEQVESLQRGLSD